MSRPTIVRHLQRLERDRLIEWVAPAPLAEHSTTSRLYHLADAGFHALAHALRDPDAPGAVARAGIVDRRGGVDRFRFLTPMNTQTTVGGGRDIGKREEEESEDLDDLDQDKAFEQSLARRWRVDEHHLVQLLPRLGQLVRVEEFVRGLVIHAPEHLGERGYRARGEWRWVRFYRLDATPPQVSGQAAQGKGGRNPRAPQRVVTTDGAVAFHVDGLGGFADMPLWRADRWHAALIVADELLQEWRSAAQLLEALLPLRSRDESSDTSATSATSGASDTALQRTPPASAAPAIPVLLLLASNERHLEWWLRLALRITVRSAKPGQPDRPEDRGIFGAVAVIPGPQTDRIRANRSAWDWKMHVDPWRAAWRSLKDGRPISLSAVLSAPSPDETVPLGISFTPRSSARHAPTAPPSSTTITDGKVAVSTGERQPQSYQRPHSMLPKPAMLSALAPNMFLPPTTPSQVFAAMRRRGRLRHTIRGNFEIRARKAVAMFNDSDLVSQVSEGAAPDQLQLSDSSGVSRQSERSVHRNHTSHTSHPSYLSRVSSTNPRWYKQHEQLCLSSLRLPGRLARVVDLLYEMPGIAPNDLMVFMGINQSSTQRYLTDLNRLGLVCRPFWSASPSDTVFHPAGAGVTKVTKAPSSLPLATSTTPSLSPQDPARAVLSVRGVHLVALRHHLNMHSRPIQQALTLARRVERDAYEGESAVRLKAAMCHDRGVYHFLALLRRATRTREVDEGEDQDAERDGWPSGRLVWCETRGLAQHRYRYEGEWRYLRPDAVGLYRGANVSFRFWLEWDRGTMNLHDLTSKFVSYATYLDSGSWRPDHGVIPHLLVVVPDRGQLELMRRAAEDAGLRTAFAIQSPNEKIWTWAITLVDWLEEQGPLAPIWWPLLPPTTETGTGAMRPPVLGKPQAVFPA